MKIISVNRRYICQVLQQKDDTPQEHRLQWHLDLQWCQTTKRYYYVVLRVALNMPVLNYLLNIKLFFYSSESCSFYKR